MSDFLTTEERDKLKALVIEMRRRGLSLPQEINPYSTYQMRPALNGYFPKNDGSFYNPTPEHEAFITSKARFLLFHGGRGSGKTASAAQKALLKISQGESGAIMNPDFENFRYSTWPEFKQWVPWNAVTPRQRYRAKDEWDASRPFSLVFRNGAKVYCKGLKDPDSARGPNINWLWYDESGRDATGEGWKIAIASVRIGNNPQAWSTGTPSGKRHWMYEFFIDKKIPEDALELWKDLEQELMFSVGGSTEQNKLNLDPAFYASVLASYTGWQRKQELGGEFVEEGGILGNPAWFDGKVVIAPPYENIISRIRYWDLAATEKKLGKNYNDPDETVGTRVSHSVDDLYYIEDQTSGFWEWEQLIDNIFTVAKYDGPLIKIYIEQEPGSGGKNQVAAIQQELNRKCEEAKMPKFTVEGHRPDGDKIVRANIWFGEAAKGQWHLVKGAWNKDFLDDLGSFPIARHDDKIDSVSGARLCIAPLKKWATTKFVSL